MSECQGTSSSKQVRYLKINWLQRDSSQQPFFSKTNTQTFNWLLSCTLRTYPYGALTLHFYHVTYAVRVNLHSVIVWISSTTLLETGAISEEYVTATELKPTTTRLWTSTPSNTKTGEMIQLSCENLPVFYIVFLFQKTFICIGTLQHVCEMTKAHSRCTIQVRSHDTTQIFSLFGFGLMVECSLRANWLCFEFRYSRLYVFIFLFSFTVTKALKLSITTNILTYRSPSLSTSKKTSVWKQNSRTYANLSSIFHSTGMNLHH